VSRKNPEYDDEKKIYLILPSMIFMNYPDRITRPVDGDECGAGGMGDAIPLLKYFKMPRPVSRIIHCTVDGW